MIAARNISSILYNCNNEAVITNMKTKCVVLADAIYVVLGWGDDDVYGAWVDRVAMMSDFYADTECENQKQKFDGAALRLRKPPKQSDFWTRAPQLKHATNNDSIHVVPGFPGEINDFKDLAGLDIGVLMPVRVAITTISKQSNSM
jgi:hypothetical protein